MNSRGDPPLAADAPRVTTPSITGKPQHLSAAMSWLSQLAPGLLLPIAIACVTIMARHIPSIGMMSPIALAMTLGIAVRATWGLPAQARCGTTFASRKLLRLAIVLLGLQITAAHLVQVGAGGVAIICASMVATFAFTIWLGRLLKVDGPMAQLIAAGTSICGASAILAANTVASAKDEDVSYAIGCITLFGSIAIFAYPLIALAIGLDARAFGLWAGASIHEVAQVVAAAFQLGPDAGELGTIAKLVRVMLLIPMIAAMGFFALRRVTGTAASTAQERPTFPYFILGFFALAALNSADAVPTVVRSWAPVLTTFLFCVSLAAMGLEVCIRQLIGRGWRPFLLAALASVFIASISLAAIKALL